MYQQGQKWQDGCDYLCECVDSMTGRYMCTERSVSECVSLLVIVNVLYLFVRGWFCSILCFCFFALNSCNWLNHPCVFFASKH